VQITGNTKPESTIFGSSPALQLEPNYLIESLPLLIMDEAKTDAGKKTFGGLLDFHRLCSCKSD
jgi:hypothetical protein